MSKIEADVIAFPVKTKLMCSACGSPGEGSCHCGAPYVTPGVRAEAAVKANPEKSDRAIAEEIGVSHETVRRKRTKSTVTGVTVEKRLGRDGKKRKPPKAAPVKAVDVKGRVAGVDIKVDPSIWQEFNERAQREQKSATAKIAELIVNEIEPGGVDLRVELPKSAQEKLDAAMRQHRRKLDAEHTARMMRIEEEVRQRVLAEGKEYLDMLNAKEKKASETIALYKEWTNNLKPIFTAAEYNVILKCLDSSAISFRLKSPDPELVKRFDQAMAIVRDKKEILLSKKDN